MISTVLANLIRGFFMGTADVVPGVSGGTIALLLGIYDRFVGAIRTGSGALGQILRGNFSGALATLRTVEWSLILPLAVGVLTAVRLLSSVLDRLLTDEPEAMAGLFLGLVVASTIVAWQMITVPTARLAAISGAVGVVTFVLLGFSSGPLSDPSLLVWFGAGAIAICAMILPGISGSFLLLMLGMYGAVLGAVHEVSDSLVKLGVFMVGAIVGLALFSSLLGWLLDNHRSTVMAVLVGLMLGSVRVLWPWPNGVGVISDEADEVIDGTGLELPGSIGDAVLPILLGTIAAAVVLGLTAISNRREQNGQLSPQQT